MGAVFGTTCSDEGCLLHNWVLVSVVCCVLRLRFEQLWRSCLLRFYKLA